MGKETLHLIECVDFREFINLIECSDDNEIVAETEIGQWKEQIIPTIYFRQNEYYRTDFNAAMNGMLLKLISTEKNISFSMEFLDTIFLSHYKILDNKFSLLKCIDRSNLTRYENVGDVKFMGVKAKNSYKIMRGMQGAPVGGLITGAIFRGAFRLAAKAEDDLIEKDGMQFSLYFLEKGEERKLDIIVESFYVDHFIEILKVNWTKITPPKPKVEEEKGGCFIATACYNDYDHPIVLQLRFFRDDFLQKHGWGQRFIKAYYKHSPKYAMYIARHNFLKAISKFIIVKPLYYLSKVLLKSKAYS